MEEVREYESTMQEKTNSKVISSQNDTGEAGAPDLHCTEIRWRMGAEMDGGGGRVGVEERDVRALKVEGDGRR